MKLFKTKWGEVPSTIEAVIETGFDDAFLSFDKFDKLDEMDVGQTIRDDDGELWERVQ